MGRLMTGYTFADVAIMGTFYSSGLQWVKVSDSLATRVQDGLQCTFHAHGPVSILGLVAGD